MRITSKMMINNAKYWLAKQAERLSKAETVSGSGKQINKPSDDPNAAATILEYRSEIAAYEQYETNLAQTSTWIEAGEEVLDSVDEYLDQALDIANELANGQVDYTETYLDNLESLYDCILDLANTTCSSNYMYGGTQTDSTPFSNEIALTSGASIDVGYYLASDASDVTVTIYDSNGDVVRTLTTSGTEGGNTISWDGLDDDGNLLASGEYTFSVSASDASGDRVAASCYQGDSGNKQVLIGEQTTAKINTDGGAIFTEALSAISDLIAAYEDGTAYDVAAELSEALNAAIDTVATERVALSNIYSQLEVSTDRVEKISTLLEEKLSTLETGSTAEAAVELSAQETAYEITTETMAKILNLSTLSDYI